MIIKRNKLVKLFLKTAGILSLGLILIIAFISPIAKYLIEKYDQQYTGRQITLDWIYINPFTGHIHVNDLSINEHESDSVFFYVHGIGINVSLLKMVSGTYEISRVTIEKPRGVVVKSGNHYNFDDLINKFAPKTTKPTISKKPTRFSVLRIKISEGEFYFNEDGIPIRYFIKKVNFDSPGMRWDTDSIDMKFSFEPGIGSGKITGDVTFNIKNQDYRVAIRVWKFNLDIIAQYMKELTNYGSFRAILDANVESTGNIQSVDSLFASGKIAISDFHFGKNPLDDYASFDELVMDIQELSPKNNKFLFDSITMDHPVFKYEKYDSLDNLQNMFGRSGENITEVQADPESFNLVLEIADLVRQISQRILKSHYRVNHLAITKGEIKFNDYSLSEKFSMELNPFSIVSNSIDKANKRMKIALNTGIKPFGNFNINLRINPKDSSDFDLAYELKKLPVAMFNPYLITETSFPLDRGTIELNGDWTVRNGVIKSNNHLLIIDPRLTTRFRNKGVNWFPMRIIMAIVREQGNAIDYEVPITGNLNNPDFKLRDVITDVLENIFVKPVRIPYLGKVKNIETMIEKSLSLKWEMLQYELKPRQEKFIEKVAGFLADNPEATIVVTPFLFTSKEKEYLLFFEAKKRYFLSVNQKNSITEEDSITIHKMSVKDPAFIAFLNRQIKEKNLFTLQQKCSRLIPETRINTKYNQLNNRRNQALMTIFKSKNADNRVKLAPEEDVFPYNGFSTYRFDYKREFPESLLKAFRQMDDLDSKAPRKRLKKERSKTGTL